MKKLNLFLALTLVAFFSSAFTSKTQQAAHASKISCSVAIIDDYLATVDIEMPVEGDPNPLILRANLYGYYSGSSYIVTSATNFYNNNPLSTASGTIDWIGGMWTANVVVNGYSYYGPI